MRRCRPWGTWGGCRWVSRGLPALRGQEESAPPNGPDPRDSPDSRPHPESGSGIPRRRRCACKLAVWAPEPGQLRVAKARRPPRLTPLGRPPPLATSGACAALPGRAHFQALWGEGEQVRRGAAEPKLEGEPTSQILWLGLRHSKNILCWEEWGGGLGAFHFCRSPHAVPCAEGTVQSWRPPVGGAPGRRDLQLVVLKVQRAGTVDEERAGRRCGYENPAAWDPVGCGGSLEEATSHDSEATLLWLPRVPRWGTGPCSRAWGGELRLRLRRRGRRRWVVTSHPPWWGGVLRRACVALAPPRAVKG